MRYYQPSEGYRRICILAHALFRTRPIDLSAAALRLAAAYYDPFGRSEPVTTAHPGYYCSMHALSAWDRVVVNQLRPAAVRRVRELQLGYIPTEPPPMLQSPWMIEVKRGSDDRERLFGNTLALCGFHFLPTNLWVLTGWCREGSHEFFTVAKWPVTWGKDDLNISDVQENFVRCEAGQWVSSPAQDRTVSDGTDWLSHAVQFAINFGELSAAEKAPLRVESEKIELRGTGEGASSRGKNRKSPLDLRWVTRHVYLDEPNHTSSTSTAEEHAQEIDSSNRLLTPVEVRAHVRRQRFGPGNSQIKRLYVDPYDSHRWTMPKPVKIIVNTKRGNKK